MHSATYPRLAKLLKNPPHRGEKSPAIAGASGKGAVQLASLQ